MLFSQSFMTCVAVRCLTIIIRTMRAVPATMSHQWTMVDTKLSLNNAVHFLFLLK